MHASSNACKFTPTGGTVRVTTKLLWPSAEFDNLQTHTESRTTPSSTLVGSTVASPGLSNPEQSPRRTSDEKPGRATSYLSAGMLDKHNKANAGPVMTDQIIVRIEVTDTGCGIQSKDMVHNKLFCKSCGLDALVEVC
jgi:osomolarity two-component system, sensor histidine kinase SLN1